jgi:hypothetical protein
LPDAAAVFNRSNPPFKSSSFSSSAFNFEDEDEEENEGRVQFTDNKSQTARSTIWLRLPDFQRMKNLFRQPMSTGPRGTVDLPGGKLILPSL